MFPAGQAAGSQTLRSCQPLRWERFTEPSPRGLRDSEITTLRLGWWLYELYVYTHSMLANQVNFHIFPSLPRKNTWKQTVLVFFFQAGVLDYSRALLPRKLTWQWEIHHLKMYFLLKLGIFQCHVSFQGCNEAIFSWKDDSSDSQQRLPLSSNRQPTKTADA